MTISEEIVSAMIETLRKIVDHGCESASEVDGSKYCYFCNAAIGAREPHADDCAFMAAKRILEFPKPDGFQRQVIDKIPNR